MCSFVSMFIKISLFYVLINHDQETAAYKIGLNMLEEKILGWSQILIRTCYALTFPLHMFKPLLMVGFRKMIGGLTSIKS